MHIEGITKENIKNYEKLILPYIYDDFTGNGDELDIEYFALAAVLDDTDEGYEDALKFNGNIAAASVLVIQPEATGDLSIVSVFTLPLFRRKRYASMLLDKAVTMARMMFNWEEEDDDEEVIVLKTLYRLPEDIRVIYEEFLMENHFTDFVLLSSKDEYESDDGLSLDVWSACCEITFIRRPEETANV